MEFLYYGTDTVIAFVAPIGTFLDIDKHTFLTIDVAPVEKSYKTTNNYFKYQSGKTIVKDDI
jgi:hypothetical protein